MRLLSSKQVNGRYINQLPEKGNQPGWKVLWWLLRRTTPKTPDYDFKPVAYPAYEFRPDDIRITFIGHCTLLVEVGGKRILTDPVFGAVASPFQFAGPRRFHPPGILLENLPPIDVVLITHNHYDHMDESAIRALGDDPFYIVPLNLGRELKAMGITRFVELDWWESWLCGQVRITATPCQHWSKRGLFDERKSLWCGFSIRFEEISFLFIGDSGYYSGFKEIGERLGPFSIAALPIGGYEPRDLMKEVHMTPEEAIQAHEDLGAGILLPTHYGCFPLTDEDPTEPPRRLFLEWRKRGYDLDQLWLLAPGQYRSLEHMIYIPTVRPVSKRIIRRADRPAPERKPENALREWGIGICPHKGEMVDLEAIGYREHIFEGDHNSTLTLDHVRCSGYGDLDECRSQHCPLRDPTYLRSYDLHGVHNERGAIEPFVEIDSPPSHGWWAKELQIKRKDD